ncbi:hypothetical protein Ancab_011656 [Ancistrocladus abbreviatus]
MVRRQTILLLLACLLVAAPQSHCTIMNIQDKESVDFKLRSLRSDSRLNSQYDSPTWQVEKRFQKTPSGPNPVGNQHPPFRP